MSDSKAEEFHSYRLQGNIDSNSTGALKPNEWTYPARERFSWKRPLRIFSILGNRFMSPRNQDITHLRSLARPETESERQEYKKMLEGARAFHENVKQPPPGARRRGTGILPDK